MTSSASDTKNDSVLLVTKHVDHLLMRLHELQMKMDLQDPTMSVIQAARATPASAVRQARQVQLCPSSSECQPAFKLEQQEVGVMTATPLHLQSELPSENQPENKTEMLDKELVAKTAFAGEQFVQDSSAVPSAVTLRDEATLALSTMLAAGLLGKQSMSSLVIQGEGRQKHDSAMKRMVLAEDVPAVKIQMVEAALLKDEVLVRPLEGRLKASQSPSYCVPHNNAEPHEAILAEQTLKDEAAHALALGRRSLT